MEGGGENLYFFFYTFRIRYLNKRREFIAANPAKDIPFPEMTLKDI